MLDAQTPIPVWEDVYSNKISLMGASEGVPRPSSTQINAERLHAVLTAMLRSPTLLVRRSGVNAFKVIMDVRVFLRNLFGQMHHQVLQERRILEKADMFQCVILVGETLWILVVT